MRTPLYGNMILHFTFVLHYQQDNPRIARFSCLRPVLIFEVVLPNVAKEAGVVKIFWLTLLHDQYRNYLIYKKHLNALGLT